MVAIGDLRTKWPRGQAAGGSHLELGKSLTYFESSPIVRKPRW